jgi:hypothetical protein
MKDNVFVKLTFIFCIYFIVSSCNKGVVKFSGQAQFSISSSVLVKSGSKSGASDVATPAYFIFSIEDASGNVVKNTEKIELYNMNDEFISKPISLVKGTYKLTSFMVLDAMNNVMYVAPLKGSSKAYLVEEPLPIVFDIQRNGVTKLNPEVLSAADVKPEDFGYVTFSFDMLKNFDFLIGVFAYNDIVNNFELTTAAISVLRDTSILYTGQIVAKQNSSNDIISMYDSIGITNKISLPESYDNYTLVVTKDGYKNYRHTFTKDELKLHYKSTDKGPLVVILEKATADKGLVAYYPFKGNANDESGNGHHGTVVGAVLSADRNGTANQAYRFNASDSYINVSGFGNFIPTQEISVSLWARTIDCRSSFALMLTPDENRFAISVNYLHTSGNSNFWDFGWRHEGGNAPGRLYFLEPFDATWHHFVFISSISQNMMKIYKDGQLRASKNEPLVLLNPENRDLKIGCGDNSGYFNGSLDEIRIYNKILSEAEIQNLYQQ